jgi:tripartite-type tricarboxylate transporter receptor subunit TctC
VIENRVGAAGILGTDAVAKAEPDGHTIAITSQGALAISASLHETMPYDSTRDLKAITLVSRVPEMLVVATSVPASTLRELIALARERPGRLNFASTGHGSLPHLAGELLKLSAGIDIVHVPYRGAAPALNDLLGQQVQMAFLDIPFLLPLVRAGKLKPIAVGSRTRVSALRDVPTMAEAGFPLVEVENWYGMVAPAATPVAVVSHLHRAAVQAIRDPGVHERLSAEGAILVANTPDEFAAFIRSEIEKWRNVARAAGVRSKAN